MACVFVGLTSLIVFGSVTSALSNWGSIELQEAVGDALKDSRLSSAGLSVTEVIVWLRWVLYGVLFLSIAGLVFAVFVARGHRASRIYLTIMCGLTFIGFVVAGGLLGLFPAALAVVCAFQLWSQDSRAWFDAKNGGTARSQTAVVAPPDPVPPSAAPVAGPIPVPAQQTLPKPVRIAGLVTLIASLLVAVFSAYYAFVYFVARDSYVESLSEDPMKGMLADYNLEPAETARLMFFVFAALGVFALLACISAGLMLVGKTYARIVTVVLAVVTVPVSFIVVGLGWPWTIAAIYVLILLRKPESGASRTT